MMSLSKRSKLTASTALWPLHRGCMSTVMSPQTFDMVGRLHIRYVVAAALPQQLADEATAPRAA